MINLPGNLMKFEFMLWEPFLEKYEHIEFRLAKDKEGYFILRQVDGVDLYPVNLNQYYRCRGGWNTRNIELDIRENKRLDKWLSEVYAKIISRA